MKRVALLCLGLAVGAASAAEAQLTMQMSNGWSFTFAGNVNAFFIYRRVKARAGVERHRRKGSLGRHRPAAGLRRVRCEGQGRQLDFGVHFGFAPQVKTGGHFASFFGDQAAGARSICARCT